MNKKGSLTSMPLGLIGFFILIIILTSLLAIQGGVDSEKIFDTLNNSQKNIHNRFNVDNTNNSITKVVYSFIDFLTYSGFEVAKAGVSYSINHPDVVNPNILIILVFIALLSPLIYPLFIIIVSLILIILEYFKTKKEKKEMIDLENANNKTR